VIKYLASDEEGKLQDEDKQIETLELEIKHCRAKATNDKKNFKVSFAVASTGSDFEKAIVGAMTSLGGIKKIGPPPAGRLEREAARILERF
jgi:hypothetical protein